MERMATLKVPGPLGELDKLGDVGAYLREQREAARLSLRQLATAAGVSNPYLSQIERGLRKPSAEVLQQIAKGLQISAEALFLRAGILEESEGLEVEVAVQSDTRLTPRQKRVLLDIYATFLAENDRAPQAEAPRTPAPAEKAVARKAAKKVAEAGKAPAKKAPAGTAATKKAAGTATRRTTTTRKKAAAPGAAPTPTTDAAPDAR